MRWLEPLRRLIGPPAQQPDINITIDPGSVIRPGDAVLLCLPVQPAGMKAAVVQAAKQWAPEGVRIVVFTSEDARAINLTRALVQLQQVLCSDRGNCAGDAGPEPLSTGKEAPHRSQQEDMNPAGGAVVGTGDLTPRVGLVPDAPSPVPDSFPDSHSEFSP